MRPDSTVRRGMARDVGIGIGNELGLSEAERTRLVDEAARLGYTSAWTNARGFEALDTCLRWWEAASLLTGVSVVPTPGLDLHELAARARRVDAATHDHFILGIGAGGLRDPEWRKAHAMEDARPIPTMRDHLVTLRRDSGAPVYLAALGPRMLRLAGEPADGVMPNWMDPKQLAWARERVAEGARKSGRALERIVFAQYVRVSVDDDPALARRALAKAALGYALPPSVHRRGGHYRAAFERMGFAAELTRLEALRERGADEDALADACADEFLRACGAWGRPDDVAAQLRRLAVGLDIAIVRVVIARPGIAAARLVVEACAPARWS